MYNKNRNPLIRMQIQRIKQGQISVQSIIENTGNKQIVQHQSQGYNSLIDFRVEFQNYLYTFSNYE